jgi:hypothetical protein
MKLLSNTKNPSSNPLQRLQNGDFDPGTVYWNPPVVLKYYTGHTQLGGFFLHPVRGGHWRKSTNDREGSRYRNYDAAFGTILRISQDFHRCKQKVFIYFASSREGMVLGPVSASGPSPPPRGGGGGRAPSNHVPAGTEATPLRCYTVRHPEPRPHIC